MNNNLDPETLKIPAYLRKKAIVHQDKQKLILTALDRKEARLKPNSKRALAPLPSRAPIKSKKYNSRSYLNRLERTPRPIPTYTQPSFEQPLFQEPVLQNEIQEVHEPRYVPNFEDENGKSFSRIGEITHYLAKIQVAIIKLTASLKENDLILIEGENEITIQKVSEMQIDRQPVQNAPKGAHIGLKVSSAARVTGSVYKMD